MQHPSAVEYIQAQIKAGFTTEAITAQLRAAGWAEDDITASFIRAQPQPKPQPLPQQQVPVPAASPKASFSSLSESKMTLPDYLFTVVAVSLLAVIAWSALKQPSRQLATTSSNTTEVKVANRDIQSEGLYSYKNLGNGYALATSHRYDFSFEVPSDYKLIPPKSGAVRTGYASQDGTFSFISDRRMRNDTSSSTLYSVRADDAKDVCNTYPKVNPNWKKIEIHGLPALENTAGDYSRSTIICGQKYYYSMSYTYAYEKKRLPELTAQELKYEQDGFEHMVESFKITNQDT